MSTNSRSEQGELPRESGARGSAAPTPVLTSSWGSPTEPGAQAQPASVWRAGRYVDDDHFRYAPPQRTAYPVVYSERTSGCHHPGRLGSRGSLVICPLHRDVGAWHHPDTTLASGPARALGRPRPRTAPPRPPTTTSTQRR